MLEGPPDRVLVHLDLVRLAPDTRVERLAVALDPARDGGPECLAGVGVPVASDVPGQAAAAGGAGEQAAEPVLAAVDPAAMPAAVPGPQRLDVLPGRRIHERAEGGRLARPQAASVERVGQHLGDMLEGEPGRSADLAIRAAARRELVHPADDGHVYLIDGDDPAIPHRSERRPVAARDAEPPAFRGVALPDPLREAPAVRLGFDRFPGPALPLVLVGGQDPLVGEQDHRTPGVEVVAGVDRRPQVAGEPGHVPDDEDLPVLAGAGEHLGPLPGGGDRPPGVRDLPRPARVEQAPALDGAGLLLELRVGPEVVRLACRRLTDPARGTAAAEVLE